MLLLVVACVEGGERGSCDVRWKSGAERGGGFTSRGLLNVVLQILVTEWLLAPKAVEVRPIESDCGRGVVL